nr:MAG TPA: hypothetical protein [Caudoviricetes sp.]
MAPSFPLLHHLAADPAILFFYSLECSFLL